MSTPQTSAERRLAQYGERVESFNCGDERAMYRLACEMRDELVKARAALAAAEDRTTQHANWLVDIRNAVGGSNFPDLPGIVSALPARHRAAALREAADRFESECPAAGGSMDLCMCHAAEPLRRMADTAGKDTPRGESTRDAETCGRCNQPFDSADARFDGRARYHDTPFCGGCVDRCHESTDAGHRCPVCTKGGGNRG